jgi:predicted DNA-binding transcriptional regulator AlpA
MMARPEVTGRRSTSEPPDELIPDSQVWKEFHISSMTGWRWSNDKTLGFPRAVKIRNRSYRSRRAIESFKARMLLQP